MTTAQVFRSTVHSREIGTELRTVRQEAGMSANELARVLNWERTKVLRMESGKRPVTVIDAAIYLTACGLRGAGAHAGMAGPFRVLQYAEHKRVVYVETRQRACAWKTRMMSPPTKPS